MTDVEFLIVGAGACGLLTAIKLREHNLLVLERAARPGGTWRDNVYPGLTCDVPSFVYEFSFAPFDWSRVYASQAEILAYLERASEGLPIRYGCEVVSARWSSDRWHVHLRSGEGLTARVLFLACGAQGTPLIPSFVEGFAGDCFHSARWPVGYDFTGKRVGVVGTAASAVQLLPHVAQKAREVVVFQRSANWVLPKREREWYGWEKLVPRSWWRWRQDLSFELFRHRWMRWLGERWALWQMRRVIRDPALRRALTPTYAMGCKRILLANDFYETLALPHVRLVTTGVELDGLDTLVLATGFRVGGPPFPVHGRDGALLGREAYLGVMAAGFPNLFLLLGPNSGLGHNSVWLMAEAQAEFALQALARGRVVEVPRAVQEAWNRGLAARFEGLVWSEPCGSWYQDEDGRIFALYPGSVADYRRELEGALPALTFGA